VTYLAMVPACVLIVFAMISGCHSLYVGRWPSSLAPSTARMATFKDIVGRPYEPIIQDDITDQVAFDISLGGKAAGRVLIGLYGKAVPKTALNFKELVKGCESIKSGKQLSFKKSIFHRIIPSFMCQGGDITMGNGFGGESVYGEKCQY
jgi:peptidylprolyl isomerase